MERMHEDTYQLAINDLDEVLEVWIYGDEQSLSLNKSQINNRMKEDDVDVGAD